MSCGIYKIENLINGKVYIGQSVNIERRFSQHKTDMKRYKRPLYLAFQKYGIENFSFDIIEECAPQLLDEREIYWIAIYDSYTNGYNLTFGGQSTGFVYSNEEFYSRWDAGMTVGQIAANIGCSSSVVTGRLKGYKDYNAFTSRQRGGALAWEKATLTNPNLYHKVYQYDLNGNYITEFSSYKEAARSCGAYAEGNTIGAAISGERLSSYGYQWRDKKYDKISPVEYGYSVRCINTGEVFSSAEEAARAMGIKSRSNISDACLFQAHKSAGKLDGIKLYWEYVKDDDNLELHQKKIDLLNKELKKKQNVKEPSNKKFCEIKNEEEKVIEKIHYYCPDCGAEVSRKGFRCIPCSKKAQRKYEISRDELKSLIRTTPFLQIGKMYGVTDNSIRKRCKTLGLPYKVKEIKSISDEEWEKI